MNNSAQIKFDLAYVTSTEIANSLGVSRAAVCQAISRGLLPDPISVNNGQITMFEREAVQPFVNEWRNALNSKRAAKND